MRKRGFPSVLEDQAIDIIPQANRMRRRPGLPPMLLLTAYLALVLTPLLLAASYQPRSSFFYRELAAGCALLGFAMLLAQFVLSGRFKTIAGRIGIDRLMRFHQLVGRIVVALLVLHATLYLIPLLRGERRSGRGRLLEVIDTPEFAAGATALVLLLILAALAIWRRRLPIPYELWRGLHGLIGATVAILGVWHALGIGRYSGHETLATGWIGLVALALSSLFYVYFFKPLLLLRHPYRVVSNQSAGSRIWELIIEPAGSHRLRFAAGQFAWVNFRRCPLSLFDHPFSISSAPDQLPRISFLIKEYGDFSNRIGAITPGHPVYLDAPHGAFTLTGREAEGIALVAGGVGIAPILGILRHLHAVRDPRPVRLLYAAEQRDQLVCIEELKQMQDEIDFKVDFILAQPPADWRGRTGVPDASTVREWVDFARPQRWLFFLCGPPPMLEAVKHTLYEIGLPSRRIVYERFTFD